MAKKNIHKTTGEQFKLFKRECEKWIKFWGMNEWKVYYDHNANNVQDKERGWCWAASTDKVATLALTKDWGVDTPTSEDIKYTAFHEVCELLLTDLDTLAKHRYSCEDEINEARHSIIRRLENVIYKRVK